MVPTYSCRRTICGYKRPLVVGDPLYVYDALCNEEDSSVTIRDPSICIADPSLSIGSPFVGLGLQSVALGDPCWQIGKIHSKNVPERCTHYYCEVKSYKHVKCRLYSIFKRFQHLMPENPIFLKITLV